MSNKADELELYEAMELYQRNAYQFVVDVLKAQPTPQQKLILDAISVPGAKVSVRSGHGIGKSSVESWVIIWFVCMFPDCRVPVTAPSAHQLFDIVWGELFKWREKMIPFFKDQFFVSSDRAYIIGDSQQRYAAARTARRENPDAFHGFHAGNLLFICEEASGIDDTIFEVGEGSMSTVGARMLMMGNPTRTDGYFHRSHTSDRKHWTCFHFSSEDSPIVDPLFITRMKERYGADSNIYKVRVKGDFPDSSNDNLISLAVVESAVDRDVLFPSSPRIAGLDVARYGDDTTALVMRQGGIIYYAQEWQGRDLMHTTGQITKLYREDKLFDRINVDAIGLGSGIVDRLAELQIPVMGINVAESSAYSDKYVRMRDELWWKCKEFFDAKQCAIHTKKIEEYCENKGAAREKAKIIINQMIGELTAIKYIYTSAGKVLMESKTEMKKRGAASPNVADALCLTFAEGIVEERSMTGKRKVVVSPSTGWT